MTDWVGYIWMILLMYSVGSHGCVFTYLHTALIMWLLFYHKFCNQSPVSWKHWSWSIINLWCKCREILSNTCLQDSTCWYWIIMCKFANSYFQGVYIFEILVDLTCTFQWDCCHSMTLFWSYIMYMCILS